MGASILGSVAHTQYKRCMQAQSHVYVSIQGSPGDITMRNVQNPSYFEHDPGGNGCNR